MAYHLRHPSEYLEQRICKATVNKTLHAKRFSQETTNRCKITALMAEMRTLRSWPSKDKALQVNRINHSWWTQLLDILKLSPLEDKLKEHLISIQSRCWNSMKIAQKQWWMPSEKIALSISFKILTSVKMIGIFQSLKTTSKNWPATSSTWVDTRVRVANPSTMRPRQ